MYVCACVRVCMWGRLRARPQSGAGHTNGRSVVCVASCCLAVACVLNLRGQSANLDGYSHSCIRVSMCTAEEGNVFGLEGHTYVYVRVWVRANARTAVRGLVLLGRRRLEFERAVCGLARVVSLLCLQHFCARAKGRANTS